jgi:anti-sigma regulatory factor (Ser/Thr protein kinase)
LSSPNGTILGEVADLGRWRNSNPAAERGRGLAILRAATTQFEINRSPQGTTVAFVL